MTDIIITAHNPDRGDVHELRRAFWAGATPCLSRGARRAGIWRGERVYLHYHGWLWGFVYFERYDVYVGQNEEGEEVVQPDSIHLRPPMHRFDMPVDLRGATPVRGWRYVDPDKLGRKTMKEIRQQTRAAEARLGWFGPEDDYRQTDPDPFPEEAMRVARLTVRADAFRSGGREAVVEFIKGAILGGAAGTPTFDAIAERVRANDWDEAVALTMCGLTDDSDTLLPPSIPIVRNGGYVYYSCAQMVCLGELDSGWMSKWQLNRGLAGARCVIDLFRRVLVEFDQDEAFLEPRLLWRPARGGSFFATNRAGFAFALSPRGR